MINWKNRKKAKPNIRDFSFVIEEVISRLPDGDSRFAIVEEPLNVICQYIWEIDGFHDFLGSDYGMPSEYEEIEKIYYEEVSLIEELLKENEIQIESADWQTSFGLKAISNMWGGINHRAYAMQIWDWYSIPWRYHQNQIYSINSPRDIMGTPIITKYPVERFLPQTVKNMEKHHTQLLKHYKWFDFWKYFGIVILSLIGLWLWSVISDLIK